MGNAMATPRTRRRIHKNERGANLVEFAVSAMVLLMLIAGTVDFGGAFQNYIILANAAREGARRASQIPCVDAGIYVGEVSRAARAELEVSRAAPAERVGFNLKAGDVTISVTPSTCQNPVGGDMVTVAVSTLYPMTFVGLIGFPVLNLKAEVDMVYFGNDQETN